MKNIRMFLVAVLLIGVGIISTSKADARIAEITTNRQIKTGCRLGNTVVPVCVQVDKTITSYEAKLNTVFDTSVAKPILGKASTFAVVYSYRSAQVGPDGYNSIDIQRGRSGMMTDIHKTPTAVWVITRDGGRTWSGLTTTNMDDVLTY